ncbi:excisionase family DNA-binding protein [Angustibacter sp. Root456]|uniref:excisionase family DNA-binding protein n=1 Tax=Angustibacter sp. Root456 TaxID=1736539 RepID=UPI0006F62478|nr:excisionase family DNA-binding protein [Angustibacter sp. Root456]KQX65785.1 hypothetical protein ASD06_09270 [Angustibacter sp. Root456]
MSPPHASLQRGRRELLSIEQAAAYLGRNPRFVRRLIASTPDHRPEVAFYMVGRFPRIDRADLDRWLDDRKVQP